MNLFIDTHLLDIVIILENAGKIISSKILNNTKSHSEFLMPCIQEVLKGNIPDSIIVVNGPGSFTGVRLGVTVAKTLSYTLNIPIRTITSLELMAININSLKKIVAFSDNNGYYCGFFDKDNKVIGDYKYLNINDYSEMCRTNDVTEFVTIDYVKVIDYSLKKEPINPHKVNPVYIKKIDVEK